MGGAAAPLSFAQLRDRVLAQAAEPSLRKAQALPTAALMSVVMPLMALVVLSVVANMAMALRVVKRNAAPGGASSCVMYA